MVVKRSFRTHNALPFSEHFLLYPEFLKLKEVLKTHPWTQN